MPPAPNSPFRKAWLQWKSLKLPWRKRFLVGLDLQGNTFWEFRDTLSSHKHRMRRIVQYPSSTQYSDVKISPQWHQWLRHTRKDAPSLTEQSMDVVRQQQLKVLAKQADERWAAKPSFLDQPGRERGQALPAMQLKDPGGYVEKTGADTATNLVSGVDDMPKSVKEQAEVKTQVQAESQDSNMRPRREAAPKKEKQQPEDPWKQNRGGPSETWQPKAWDGSTTSR